jgi:hypothetical protein
MAPRARAQAWAWVQALRAPLLLGSLGAWVLHNRAALGANLAITFQDVIPMRAALNLWVVRPDYFLYLPNMVVCIVYLAALVALFELRPWRALPPPARTDRALALAGLGVALSMLAFLRNLKPGLMQILLTGTELLVVWLFILANARLAAVERLADRPWMRRLLAWTFPVSDLFAYQLHRRRTAAAGWVRFAPTACVVAAASALLLSKGSMLWTAARAERIDTPVFDAQYALVDDGGFWFTNGNGLDPRNGIWYYDDRARRSWPVIRVADCRQFYAAGGSFFVHDRYDDYIRRIDMRTHRPLWEVPVGVWGTYQVVGRGDWIVAAGEGGYLISLDADGRVLGQRQFHPLGTWVPQAVWGDQVAFLSGDERVHLWNRELTEGRAVHLPLAPGVRRFVWDEYGTRMRCVTDWTDYDPQRETLYVQTLWGEIFRYDVKADAWRPSLKAAGGLRTVAVDGDHGLVFAWNYYGGYIEVLDDASGARVGVIQAGPLGRYINVDPARKVAIASTHGYGVWRFDYSRFVERRDAMNAQRYAAR